MQDKNQACHLTDSVTAGGGPAHTQHQVCKNVGHTSLPVKCLKYYGADARLLFVLIWFNMLVYMYNHYEYISHALFLLGSYVVVVSACCGAILL